MPKTSKTIDLSPEAAAKLALPVAAHGYELMDAFGCLIGTIDHFGDNDLDASFAAFIAALVNEALTPAAPAVTIVPDTNLELGQLITTEWEAAQPGVPMCALPDCLDGAEPGRDFCARHLPRWTVEDMLRREG